MTKTEISSWQEDLRPPSQKKIHSWNISQKRSAYTTRAALCGAINSGKGKRQNNKNYSRTYYMIQRYYLYHVDFIKILNSLMAIIIFIKNKKSFIRNTFFLLLFLPWIYSIWLILKIFNNKWIQYLLSCYFGNRWVSNIWVARAVGFRHTRNNFNCQQPSPIANSCLLLDGGVSIKWWLEGSFQFELINTWKLLQKSNRAPLLSQYWLYSSAMYFLPIVYH